MGSTLTTYISLASFSGVLVLFLSFYSFSRRKHIKSALPLAIYALTLSIYCISYALSLSSVTLDEVKFWNIMKYMSLPFSAPIALIIVLNYLEIKWNKWVYASLFIIPIVSLSLVASNDAHHLFYKEVKEHDVLGLPFLHVEIGIAFVVHGIFFFSCMLYSFIRICIRLFEASKALRKQLVILALAQLIPMLTFFLYLIGVTPEGIEPVPLILWISVTLFIWSIFSSHMFFIKPIAKDMIFHSMSEGVIVLDINKRLVDFNNASREMFTKLSLDYIGRPIAEVWSNFAQSEFPLTFNSDVETADFMLNINHKTFYYEARVSLLKKKDGTNIGYLILLIDVTLTMQLQQRLEKQAFYDGLTQIYNRGHFIELATDHLEEAKKNNTPFTIILFDLDHFKAVNDTYGHEAGDQLLNHIVTLCKKHLPSDTIFARYGGEEFIIAMPNYTILQAKHTANTIRKIIATSTLQVQNHDIYSTASFGVSELNYNKTLSELILEADQALYEVKRNGRNHVKCYTIS